MPKRIAAATIACLIALPAFAQSIEDEALGWLQNYIRVDTINPPGNETRAVEFIANILDAEGIPYQTAESAPGRGSMPLATSSVTRIVDALGILRANPFPPRIVPAVATGFTDSHFTRDLGIASYGFDPIVVPEYEFTRIHGNDERVNIAAFKRGVSDHLAIIEAVVYD